MSLAVFIGLSLVIFGITFFIFVKTKIYWIIKLLFWGNTASYYVNILKNGEDGFAIQKLNLTMSSELLWFSGIMFLLYVFIGGRYLKYKR